MLLSVVSASRLSCSELTACVPNCLHQADVGPFLPQRFAPPDWAWKHAARCYKQAVIPEVCRAFYGPIDEPVDAEAEPTADQALFSDNMITSEGGVMWRTKRNELGLGDSLQTADNIMSQTEEVAYADEEPPRSQRAPGSSQPRDKAWGHGSQWRSTGGGSSWGSSWWQGGQSSTWWQGADSAAAWSSQPASSSGGFAYMTPPGNVDHRGCKVVKLWGSGSGRW